MADSDDKPRKIGIVIGIAIGLAVVVGMFALGWRIFFS